MEHAYKFVNLGGKITQAARAAANNKLENFMNNMNMQKTPPSQNCFNTNTASKKYYYQYPTTLGDITIICTEDAITTIHLGTPVKSPAASCEISAPCGSRQMDIQALPLGSLPAGINNIGEHVRTAIMDKAFLEIKEYLEGKRKTFDVPLAPKGTAFQQKVWNALRTIPYGETRSYSEIAEMIGNPKACRAVGMANNKNPIIIMIPCHRVVGKNGSLAGYACGLEKKEYLLNLEIRQRLEHPPCKL